MKIKYHNKKVEKQCTDYKTAAKVFDSKTAEKLQALINLIENAVNLRDIAFMPHLHFHQLQGKRKKSNQYAMDIDGRKSSYRLIVIPLDENGNEIVNDGTQAFYDCTNILLIMEVSKHYE